MVKAKYGTAVSMKRRKGNIKVVKKFDPIGLKSLYITLEYEILYHELETLQL